MTDIPVWLTKEQRDRIDTAQAMLTEPRNRSAWQCKLVKAYYEGLELRRLGQQVTYAMTRSCACPECSAFGRYTHTEQQEWWHDAAPYDLPEDPHAQLGFLRMALWLLLLIPLHEARRALRSFKFPNRPDRRT